MSLLRPSNTASPTSCSGFSGAEDGEHRKGSNAGHACGPSAFLACCPLPVPVVPLPLAVAEDVRMAMHLAYTDEANDLLGRDPWLC